MNNFQLGLFGEEPEPPQAVTISQETSRADRELPQVMILTVKQPWATALISHGKDIENRGWSTSYRGWVLIHAGKSIDPDTNGHKLPDPTTLPLGCVIGAIYLIAVARNYPSTWAEPRCWHWRHQPQSAIALPSPIPWRGAQGLMAANPNLVRLLPADILTLLRTKPIAF
jgi:hypothetical protein